MTRIRATVGVTSSTDTTRSSPTDAPTQPRTNRRLRIGPEGVKGPLRDGATYSHYVVGIPIARRRCSVAKSGVQLGELIQYSIPHLSSYHGPNVAGFENSLLASRHLVNFPVNARPADVERIVEISMSQVLQ